MVSKIRKTRKSKKIRGGESSRCENFCKDVFIPEADNLGKELEKTFNSHENKKIIISDKDKMTNCKSIYCDKSNERFAGYIADEKEFYDITEKKIKKNNDKILKFSKNFIKKDNKETLKFTKAVFKVLDEKNNKTSKTKKGGKRYK